MMKSVAICLLVGMWAAMSAAGEISANDAIREKFKALDVQVQDIKQETLAISGALIQFEEKEIYPPRTRLTVFLAISQGGEFPLDSIKISIDGQNAVSYTYSSLELDALQRGGAQRIYTGNIQAGEHVIEVQITGKSAGKEGHHQNARYKFTKDEVAKIIEISLSDSDDQTISFKDSGR